MSDANEDNDAMVLVLGAYQKLQGLKPGHELLKYLLFDGRDEYLVTEYFAEFADRFGKPDTPPDRRRGYRWNTYALAKYFLALEEACQDPEKVIVVSHKSSFDDDIPF